MIYNKIFFKIFILIIIYQQIKTSDFNQNAEKSSLQITTQDAINLAKNLISETPEGDLINNIETLLQPNEIEKMKNELEKEYNIRKIQQNKNSIQEELQHFQSIILNIIEEYLNETKKIQNINEKSTKDIDLNIPLLKIQDILNSESIENNLMNLNILIDLYCIINQEDFLYKSIQSKFFSEIISLNEYYNNIINYMKM